MINRINPVQPAEQSGKLRQKRLRKACEEFTAFFVKQMVGSMRKTVPKSEFMSGGNAENIFKDMLDMEYSKQIAQSRQLNLADILYQKLNRDL